MQVNQNLSNFSDVSVQTAFVIYALALFFAAFYYGKIQTVIDGRRARDVAKADEKSKVLVGAGTETVASSASGADQEVISLEELAAREAKANKIGGMTQSLIWLGVVLHVVAIVLRGLATGRFPFGNLYEYVLMVSAGVIVISSIALQRKEWRTLWPWILTPTLALMFYGSTKLYAESAPVVPALQSYWLPIHVTVVSLGASIGIISGIASLLSMLR
ncbi:MAG: cytochrome c biogenesis protein, partial [Corynebacterium flavescens]